MGSNLTENEINIIKTSWEPVRIQSTESGVKLLILLFERYPHYQQLFPFRDIPLTELSSNKRFKAHAVSVIYGFSAIVDKLDDSELLVPILHKLGETHAPRNVTDQAYWDLKEVLLELFSSFMTEEQVNTWRKVLDIATPLIIEGLNLAKNK